MPDHSQLWYGRPLPGAGLNMAHYLTQGMVGCWLLNENGGMRAMDIGPYQNNGLLVSFPDPPPRPFNGIPFDGAATYIDLGSDNRIRDFTAMTCVVWLKTVLKAGASWQMPIDSGRYSTSGYNINQDDGLRNLQIQLRNSAGTVTSLSLFTFLDDEWLQTGWVWDGATGWTIKNGTLLAGEAASGTILSSGNPFLGRRNEAATQYWAGSIALFQLWNRILSEQDIKNLYISPYQMIGR